MDYVKNSTLLPFEQSYRIITQRADALFDKLLGCNRREISVLLCVDGEVLSQRRIGDMLGLHPNVLVKILDGMEEKKLLQRVRRQADRREQGIQIGEKGKRLLEKYLKERPAVLRQIFRPLSEEQIGQWTELAKTVVRGSPETLVNDESDG
jgi:DNA-binding MarR family transcriptional regulator